ncbi:MAG: glycosyltransferase family 39 protein [Candidatus Aenigmarchaeota archaeon]|nr:glycosyltransferase family 39 protein [Candidatus Aenigmarchaeota archaeon]
MTMRTSIKYDKKVISSGINKYETLAVFLIALAIFSLPTILRWTYFDNPSIIGFPTYLHQRQALDLDGYDELSFGGRAYTYPPLFSYAIAGFSLLMPIHIGGMLLVAIMGAVSAAFFYLIVREHISRKYALLSSILLILVPGTIYFNAHLSSRAPPFALGMAAIYFLLRKYSARKNLSPWLAHKNIIIAGIFLGVAALFHPETAFFFGLVGLFRAVKDRRICISLLLAVVIASAYYISFIATHGFPEYSALHEEYRSRQYSLESTRAETFFFELAPNGYLNFAIAGLAVFGIAKKRHMFLFYWLVLAIAFALIAERFAVYLAVPVVLLALYALIMMEKKTWFKTALTLVLIYAIMLASVKIFYFAQFYPTKEQYGTMIWIKQNTPENATILSDWQWGHWIAGIAERRNFVDGYAEYAPNVTARINELEQFYKTCQIPEGYNISYIYMEKWFAASKNITCMDKFQLVHENSGFAVYKV